jgi:hypothetical protein
MRAVVWNASLLIPVKVALAEETRRARAFATTFILRDDAALARVPVLRLRVFLERMGYASAPPQHGHRFFPKPLDVACVPIPSSLHRRAGRRE